jgi:zinc and cadmium transporter
MRSAVADLIPGFHRRPELKITFLQVSLMALGVTSVWLMRGIAEHSV